MRERRERESMNQDLDLKGMALMTMTWYTAARKAPMNGPSQKIHCNNNKTDQSISATHHQQDIITITITIRIEKICKKKRVTMSSQAWSWLKMIAAPRLLAGLMPVPVMGIVAK